MIQTELMRPQRSMTSGPRPQPARPGVLRSVCAAGGWFCGYCDRVVEVEESLDHTVCAECGHGFKLRLVEPVPGFAACQAKENRLKGGAA